MSYTRDQLEDFEYSVLAGYAQKSRETRGRVYPEPPARWRTHFQRDRDRVIHSRAFRILEYKTQVFLNGSGDPLRTRLTHTVEVAAIGRNIASALRLNEDLVETIALAHDLGHPPFGHVGESCLNRIMKDEGGFEHNLHSLKIVDEVERKYPLFPGLNLSWEVREGLSKHHTPFDNPKGLEEFTSPSFSLEAQVADLADEIAYNSHDLDDGLESGLLDVADLEKNVDVWKDATAVIRSQYTNLPKDILGYYTVRCIIDSEVRDLLEVTEQNILDSGVHSADEVRNRPESLVQFSKARREMNQALSHYLYQNLYLIPAVGDPNQAAAALMEELFYYFMEHPDAMQRVTEEQIKKAGLKRTICDHIAGMTDRSVILAYEKFFGKQVKLGHFHFD